MFLFSWLNCIKEKRHGLFCLRVSINMSCHDLFVKLNMLYIHTTTPSSHSNPPTNSTNQSRSKFSLSETAVLKETLSEFVSVIGFLQIHFGYLYFTLYTTTTLVYEFTYLGAAATTKSSQVIFYRINILLFFW